ncbi:Heat shock cognate 70 kDa protein [Taenia solium]|eukprot:TsM_000327900 transcript=TsM_000327900 gene=TsM_000327900
MTGHGSATLNAPNSTEPIRVPVSVAGDEVEKLKQEDEKAKCMMAAKTPLVSCIQKIKSGLESEEVKQKIPQEHRKSMLAMCDRAIKWTVTEREATKEDYEKTRTKFVDVASLLMEKGHDSL